MVLFNPFILYIFRAACKIQVGCSGLIYKKSLRLKKSFAEEGQNGKIINLLSSDLDKLQFGLQLLHESWKGPLELIAFFVVIYMEIGLAAVVGMAFLVCFVPLQGKQKVFKLYSDKF